VVTPDQPVHVMAEDEGVTNLLTLYGHVLGMLQYEGSGIWSRFNTMFSVNALLFGVASFVFAGKPAHWQSFLVGLGVLGITLSLWSVYVLRRLWMWQRHWKAVLEGIESGFPVARGWARALSTRPAALRYKEHWYTTWFMKYTQPFFGILTAVWIFVIILASIGAGPPAQPQPAAIPSPCCVPPPCPAPASATLPSSVGTATKTKDPHQSQPVSTNAKETALKRDDHE